MEEQGTHAANAPARVRRLRVEPCLSSPASRVCVMIQDRERREMEISEERRHHEQEQEEDHRCAELQRQESEHTIAQMLQQMERLQGLFIEHSVATRGHCTAESIKLTKLTDEDDMESYLTTFERIMATNEVSRERWSFQLALQLTGKAQQAYAALPPPRMPRNMTVSRRPLSGGTTSTRRRTVRDSGSCDQERVSLPRNSSPA